MIRGKGQIAHHPAQMDLRRIGAEAYPAAGGTAGPITNAGIDGIDHIVGETEKIHAFFYGQAVDFQRGIGESIPFHNGLLFQ